MTTLTTARLVLEPLRPADLPALHAHWTEPEVRRYLWDGETIPEERVRGVIRQSDALFRRDRAGLWAVRPQSDDTLIGCAGFWFFHDPPERELVLSLSHAWWGRGLARECASALLDFAFDELRWPMVQGTADTPNEASLRLMRRLGMLPAGQRPGEFGTAETFRITRDRWGAGPAASPAPVSA
jgi:[ribosomal protein S5]-alanine N-acetyltransferase